MNAVADLVRPEAVNLFSDSIGSRDRVLVTGASGWFGRTTLALLEALHVRNVLAVSSTRKIIHLGSKRLLVVPADLEAMKAFAPTIVLNFAFLTRDRWTPETSAEYLSANRRLTRNFLELAKFPSVEVALTISSGAALAYSDNPYGELKRAEELAVESLVAQGRQVIVLRAWSVSGPLVRHPERYLFSDLVLQAASGFVRVKAPGPVMRRYVAVDDFLAVGLRCLRHGSCDPFDSGGPLVEAHSLARLVGEVTGATVQERPEYGDKATQDIYFSDNRAWTEACERFGFHPAPLREQVVRVHKAMLAS